MKIKTDEVLNINPDEVKRAEESAAGLPAFDPENPSEYLAHCPEDDNGNRIVPDDIFNSFCKYLPDGTFIQEKKASDTFIKAIQLAGEMNVRELGLTSCRVPIVSNTIDAKYGRAQHPVGNGLYVLTHSSTYTKKMLLDRISKAFNLGWKVEIIA